MDSMLNFSIRVQWDAFNPLSKHATESVLKDVISVSAAKLYDEHLSLNDYQYAFNDNVRHKYDAIVTTTMRRTICARIQFYWFVLNTIWDPNERWYIKMYTTLQMINETVTFTPFYMASKCIRPEIDYSLTSIHLSFLYFNKDMLSYEQKSSNRSSIA